MTYLIDTHILLWLLFSPKTLSKKVLAIVENPHNNLLVSQLSFWEVSLKYGLGKLKLIGYLPEDLIKATKEMNVTILEFDNVHLLKFHHLRQTIHKDPFDRLLIWQALSLDIPIITKDKSFNLYKPDGLKVIY